MTNISVRAPYFKYTEKSPKPYANYQGPYIVQGSGLVRLGLNGAASQNELGLGLLGNSCNEFVKSQMEPSEN